MTNKDKIDYASEVEMLLNSRRINQFMATYLIGMSSGGLNESLWQEGIDDAIVATELGVDLESEFYIFFYIDHFVEDMVEDIFKIKLNDNEEELLKKYLFSIRKDIDLYDLLSFRVAILKWTKSNNINTKQAHPNSGSGFLPLKKYDLNKWQDLTNNIIKNTASGMPKVVALQSAADTLESPEKFDFLSWYNIKYIRSYSEIYNVNNKIKKLNRSASHMSNFFKEGAIISDKQFYYVPKLRSMPEQEPRRQQESYTEQHAVDFESVRNKVMSRVFSIDKLIEKYRKVLNDEQLDSVEEALVELRKRVRRLKLASSINDSLIKTANVIRSHAAYDVADELLAIAADSELPMASPISDTSPPNNIEPPIEVDEDIKETPSNISEEQREIIIGDIVAQLEAISTVIKSREIVRALSKVDILLNKLYMDTFFPELSDAQAKLIEAYSYASNKVEDILPKIKGGTSDDKGLEIPELSDESKELAKEVDELSDNIPIKPKKVSKEVEESVPRMKIKPKKLPVLPKSPITTEVEEEPTLHNIPALER